MLEKSLTRKGYTVWQERLFPTVRGNYKPDLVVWNGVQAMVIDVTITSDNIPDPNTAHMEKVFTPGGDH